MDFSLYCMSSSLVLFFCHFSVDWCCHKLSYSEHLLFLSVSQSLCGGQRSILRLGSGAQEMHHAGRERQHEPMGAEHYTLSCEFPQCTSIIHAAPQPSKQIFYFFFLSYQELRCWSSLLVKNSDKCARFNRNVSLAGLTFLLITANTLRRVL